MHNAPYYVKKLFEQAENLKPNTSFFDQLRLDLLLREVLIYMSDTSFLKMSKHLTEIIKYIEQHYAENLSLSALSEHFSLSESYIARLFKKELSEKPSEYVNRIRISIAKTMLSQTTMSVTEIAEKVGGALGFDTYAAEEIIKLKKSHPEIELHLYLPCKDQEARWSERDKEKYYEILKCADYVDCPDTPYYDGCMRARNYKMVDNSSLCISYLKDNVKSGTAQTVRYACQNGLFLCNLSTSKDSCFFEIKEKYFR
jgi:uncharacterized phage-like protein YoqJ